MVQLLHSAPWTSPPSLWSSVTPGQIDCGEHKLRHSSAAENRCKFLLCMFCRLIDSDTRWRPGSEKIRVEFSGRPYSQGRGTAGLHVTGAMAQTDQGPIDGLYNPLIGNKSFIAVPALHDSLFLGIETNRNQNMILTKCVMDNPTSVQNPQSEYGGPAEEGSTGEDPDESLTNRSGSEGGSGTPHDAPDASDITPHDIERCSSISSLTENRDCISCLLYTSPSPRDRA